MNSISFVSILAFGFVLGLKHAVEADHVAAVSTIASEHKSVIRSSLVGGLWGLGHTISLMVAGILIIVFHVEISARLAMALEFCVGLMLIGLGANVLRKLARGGHLHMHVHQHGGRRHTHPHIHDLQKGLGHSHHGLKLNASPLLIGMVHGLAGSAALMLLVLATISQPMLALFYVLVFGMGSTGGMMIMSALVGLPAMLTAGRFTRLNVILRAAAGVLSLALGLVTTYAIGASVGLFGS
jgi:hypothetical protein